MAVRFGPVEVDVDAYELRRDGKTVHVEPQVFDVLRYLLEHRDRMVSKGELLEQVWGTRFVSESALTSRIKAVRRAVGDDGREQRVIRTVHGRGYRFVAPIDGAASPEVVGVERVAPVAETPLLEREQAWRVLDEAVGDAASGRGRVVLVSGEAGIGKSALVAAFIAHNPHVRVLAGACDDLVTPRPLGALHDVAAEGFPELVEALARPSPGDLQRELLDELRRGPSPAVLVVEDVHWADEATIDLLVVLARRLGDVPAVIVLTFRDGDIVGTHPLLRLLGSLPPAVARRVALEPLSAEAVAELVGPERAAEVLEVTGGIPFFVTEVAALDPGSDAGVLPASVAHVVRARVARLPARTAQLLDVLGVEPSRTDVATLDVLWPEWADDIEPAERAGVVVVNGPTVAFRHELARRAVLDALPAGRQRALHREMAAVLVAAEADPARVVHHAEAGGDDALLVEQALLAARRAATVSAHREAWSHYRRAVPLLGLIEEPLHAPVLEDASREAYAADDAAAAMELGRRALELWRRRGDALDVGRVHRWLSRVHWYQGRRLESEVQAELAVRVLEPLPPSVELAWAYSNLSQLAMLAWRSEETVHWGERAIDLARQLDAEEVLVHALLNVATDRFRDDIGDQQPLWDVVARAKEAGLHHEATRGMISLGYSLLTADFPVPAGEITARGVEYAERYEVETLRRYLLATLGRVKVLVGQWDEAASILHDVVSSGSSVSLIVGLSSLALLQVRQGDDAAAATTLERAWPLAEAAAEAQRIVPLALVEAERAWLAGRLDLSVRGLRDAYAMVTRTDGHAGGLARWMQEAGALPSAPADVPEPHRAELEGRWTDAADAWEARGMPYEQARALARTGVQGRKRAMAIARQLGAQPLVDRLQEW